jgi:8-oxo-dGTP pyrophosphatase MutT (NUDIX family)
MCAWCRLGSHDEVREVAPIKTKVLAYITHGERLLVFRHTDFPEAGIQVPGGSVEPGEDPAAAVLRETEEETGLTAVTLVCYLGECLFDLTVFGRDEFHRRKFYHLRCVETPPETWHHSELTPSEGPPDPILFEFWWARLPDEVPTLIADMGAMLPELWASLQMSG